MKHFSQFNLSEEIQEALKALGYIEATKVQEEVIPYVQSKKDVLVKSRTGSGKTASFGIPICEDIDWLQNKAQALVLTPTRELAVQVAEEITHIGRYKRIKATAIYGKESIRQQASELKNKNHVIVGTPGRILDHMERGSTAFDNIRYFILDEVDEMLNMGFLDQVEKIMRNIPKDRVTLFFSATVSERIKSLSKSYMKDSVEIEIIEEEKKSQITHLLYEVSEENKQKLLNKILVVENPDSGIIFCNTIENVDKVYRQMSGVGHSCQRLHGDMEQVDRLEVIKKYRRGTFRYLIATDVAARGIDIDNVSLVLNYDVPQDKEVYVHRAGRTGRKDIEGRAITFATNREDKYIDLIRKYMEITFQLRKQPTDDEVEANRRAYEEKLAKKVQPKVLKSDAMNKEIMKLYFNAGKNKKLRTVHFVATICNVEGMTSDDIGIISILERNSFVEILNGKGKIALEGMKDVLIAGKNVRVSKAEK